MRVRVLSDLQTARGVVPAGKIIEINDSLLVKLSGKVEPLPDGKELPHYCQAGDCHCSEKLPGRNHPTGCIRFHCEYHPV